MSKSNFLNFLYKHKRIVLLTSSGYNNIGQETVLLQIIKEIIKKKENISIICNSYNPETSSKIHNFSQVKFYKTTSYKFFKEFFFSKIVVYAGDEISSKRYDELFNKHQYFQGKFRIFMSFISILLKKYLYFYEVGLYSHQTFFPKFILKICLDHAKEVVARDKISKKEMKKHTINKILIKKDSAFYLEYIPQRKTNTIGFALMNPLDEKVDDFLVYIIKKNILDNPNKKFIFFIFSKHPFVLYENDLAYTKEIISRIKKKFKYKIIYSTIPSEVKTNLSQISYFISMRYHSTIFAKSLKLPIYIIPGTIKTKKIFID